MVTSFRFSKRPHHRRQERRLEAQGTRDLLV